MNEQQEKGGALNLELLPCFGSGRELTPAEQALQRQVAALEERLEQMRLSRRVLMRILERTEQDRRVELENLRRENDRLRKKNYFLARLSWENIRQRRQ